MVLLLVSKKENHNAKYGFLFFFPSKKKKNKVQKQRFFFKPETGFVFFFSLKPESKYFFFPPKPECKPTFLVYIYIYIYIYIFGDFFFSDQPNLFFFQIRRLPGARRSHFDVCFPGYNGGQAVPQHLDTTPTNCNSIRGYHPNTTLFDKLKTKRKTSLF